MNTQDLEKLRVNVDAEVDRLINTTFFWLKPILTETDLYHLKNIANSIVLSNLDIVQGGGFVQAVRRNDLRDAVNRADSVMIKCLPVLSFINDMYFEI